jgi:hypothetical protein
VRRLTEDFRRCPAWQFLAAGVEIDARGAMVAALSWRDPLLLLITGQPIAMRETFPSGSQDSRRLEAFVAARRNRQLLQVSAGSVKKRISVIDHNDPTVEETRT